MMESYLTYDEFGLVQIRCMVCNEPIAERTYIEIQSKTVSSKKEKVLAVKRLGNHAKRRIELSDGTYAEILICKGCRVTPLDYAAIKAKLNDGWRKEMEFSGASRKTMAEHLKRTRKLEVIDDNKDKN